MLFKIGNQMGIDLGTSTVLVYTKRKGIILKEPSVVAIDRNNKNKVLAVGEEARRMLGKTPGNITAVRPLKDGVISDYDMTEKMLKYFIKKAGGNKRGFSPDIVICIPCKATDVEKRAVKDAAKNAGARKVFLIEEPLAAAIGVGLDIKKASGSMIIDVGGGTTDIAVISLGGIVVKKSIKVAGDKFDEAIISFIKEKYKLMIDESTAEDLKIDIGSAVKMENEVSMEIKGRDIFTGLPKNIKITSEEIRGTLEEAVHMIAEAAHSVLELTPPELAADIADKGIIMTGGGSLLNGLDKLIQRLTNVPVYIAKDSISCVAIGTGKMLNLVDKLEETFNGDQLDIN